MQHSLRCRLFLLCLGTLWTASALADEYPAPLAKMELADGDSLVFLGDSITHQCLYTQYVEDYFYTRMPHLRLKIHNAGVGGAKAWDALQRFDRDVAAYKPKYVTILLGMNDGQYQPFNQEIWDRYHADMTELVGRIVETGATPVLMTPTMYDSRAARIKPRPNTPPERLEQYNSVLSYYGMWLQEVALNNGYGFVDMFSPLNQLTLEQRKQDAKFTMIADAVHPGPAGQVVMAVAIITDMQQPRQVSNIRVTIGKNGKATSKVTGGKLTDLTADENGCRFTWTAQSLPWVVPEEAQLGAELTKLGHRLSREALEIHGLPAGRYELTIDGETVGTYPSTGLARHIELQSNPKTPQYKQAAEVAALNKQRNEGPVRSLRGEWSVFQQYARLKATLDSANDQQKKQFENLSGRMEGREERISKLEAEARELEDKIFAINQPQPREYVLKLVK